MYNNGGKSAVLKPALHHQTETAKVGNSIRATTTEEEEDIRRRETREFTNKQT